MVGNTMIDSLVNFNSSIQKSNILKKIQCPDSYGLMTFHRPSNVDRKETLSELLNTIEKCCRTLTMVLPLHPRTKKRISQLDYSTHKNIKLVKPFSFSDYNFLQINARAVISDSGTISEESSILNFPAINLRESHERPEAMEEGAVIMSGINYDRVCQSLEVLLHQKRGELRTLNIVNEYKNENVSEKLIRVILSYTDYIKREIWKCYI